MMKKKFRLLDMVLILVILFMAVGGYRNKSMAENKEAGGEKVEIVITKDTVPDFVGENIKEGDMVFERMSGKKLGVVKKVEILPALNLTSDIHGQSHMSSKEGYSCVRVTVETDGARTGRGIAINGYNFIVGKTENFTAGLSLLEKCRITDIH